MNGQVSYNLYNKNNSPEMEYCIVETVNNLQEIARVFMLGDELNDAIKTLEWTKRSHCESLYPLGDFDLDRDGMPQGMEAVEMS